LIWKAFKLIGTHPLGGGESASGYRWKKTPQLVQRTKLFRQTTAHHMELLTTGSMSAAAPKIVQVKVVIHRSHGNLLFTHMGLINWDLTLEVYRNLVTIVST
jgi:hypothetical protein